MTDGASIKELTHLLGRLFSVGLYALALFALWEAWALVRRRGFGGGGDATVLRRLAFLIVGATFTECFPGLAANAVGKRAGPLAVWLLWDALVMAIFLAPTLESWSRAGFYRGPIFRWVATGQFRSLQPRSLSALHLVLLFGLAISASLAWVWWLEPDLARGGRELNRWLIDNPYWLLWFVARGAVAEEIIFRGYLLVRLYCLLARILERPRLAWCAAVVLSSAAFALGHGELVQPLWYKLLQAFLLGGVLAIVARAASLEAAIVFHAAFNMVAVLLSLLQ